MNDSEVGGPDPLDPRPQDDSPRRSRARRAGVQQIFEVLETQAPERPKILTNSIGVKFLLIPSGSFSMGSPAEEPGHRQNEGPVHEVLLQPFYLGVYPVTQEQYQAVMGQNPSRFNRSGGGSLEHPVENVSWEDAVLFCKRLADMPAEKRAGQVYRLPTEAEWEYACRAGTRTAFAFGASLSSRQANFDGDFPYDAPREPVLRKTSKVGSYAANNFGLYDMHGNVWEWCADWYDGSAYAHSPARDPQGASTGQFRVVRGGSWRNHAATCRSAYRNALVRNNRDIYTGFRLVSQSAG